MDILFFHLFTIHRQYCRFVFFTKFFLKLLRFFCIWFLTVKQYHKRLSYRFEFFYRPFFCLNIIFPRQIRNASVCRYNNPYCSMIPDHFLRPDCSRFRKRDLIFKPRCLYLPLFVLFNMAGCSFCHKTDTVDEPHLRPDPLRKLQLRRLLVGIEAGNGHRLRGFVVLGFLTGLAAAGRGDILGRIAAILSGAGHEAQGHHTGQGKRKHLFHVHFWLLLF